MIGGRCTDKDKGLGKEMASVLWAWRDNWQGKRERDGHRESEERKTEEWAAAD